MFRGKLVAEVDTGDIQYFILKFLPVLGPFPFLYQEANKICLVARSAEQLPPLLDAVT